MNTVEKIARGAAMVPENQDGDAWTKVANREATVAAIAQVGLPVIAAVLTKSLWPLICLLAIPFAVRLNWLSTFFGAEVGRAEERIEVLTQQIEELMGTYEALIALFCLYRY